MVQKVGDRQHEASGGGHCDPKGQTRAKTDEAQGRQGGCFSRMFLVSRGAMNANEIGNERDKREADPAYDG